MNDELLGNLRHISEASYTKQFQKLYEQAKFELQNAQNFIELQKLCIANAKVQAIYECLLEVKNVRGFAERGAHSYLDIIIKDLEEKIADATFPRKV